MNAVLHHARWSGYISRHLFSRLSPSLFWLVLTVTLAQAGSAAAASFPFTFTDRLGRTVTLPAAPRRVVSLAPTNTELAFALGAGDRLVGVTTFCNYPAAAIKLPKVGGFAARTISIEAIVALKPDLVLTGDRDHKAVIQALEGIGVPVAAVQPRDWAGIQTAIRLFGHLFETTDEAERLIATSVDRLRVVAAKVEPLPLAHRAKVFWMVFDEPMFSAGPRSLVGEAITMAGGINLFADLADEYPQISAEAVIARDPQVIIGPLSLRQRALSQEALRARPGWAGVAAVKTGRIVILPDEPVTRAGPRFVEGVEMVARALYPELFPDTGEGRNP